MLVESKKGGQVTRTKDCFDRLLPNACERSEDDEMQERVGCDVLRVSQQPEVAIDAVVGVVSICGDSKSG